MSPEYTDIVTNSGTIEVVNQINLGDLVLATLITTLIITYVLDLLIFRRKK